MVKFLLLAVCVAITVWFSLIYIGRLIRGFEIHACLVEMNKHNKEGKENERSL